MRDGVLRLVELAEDEGDFGIIGAGIMEVFIGPDESGVAWIEQHAATSEKFRRSLANVYIWDEPEWVMARVERAACTRLPRPQGWSGP